MDISILTQEIQAILAPAVLISCSALFLMGFQTKFSNLANRFRLLNHEKQSLEEQSNRTSKQESRLTNLKIQISIIFRRALLVKNAIVITYFCIFLFTGISIFILCSFYFPLDFHFLIIVVFSLGLLLLLTTSILMILEANLFFDVIKLENKSRAFFNERSKG